MLNNYKNGNWNFYNKDEILIAKGNYKNGVKDGAWVGMYANGKVFYLGNYLENMAHGNWKYFFDDGSFFQEGNFVKDLRRGKWKICIYKKGPCKIEIFEEIQTPPLAGIKESDLSKE